jgi:hypothetical protein
MVARRPASATGIAASWVDGLSEREEWAAGLELLRAGRIGRKEQRRQIRGKGRKGRCASGGEREREGWQLRREGGGK